jgi:nitroreductase
MISMTANVEKPPAHTLARLPEAEIDAQFVQRWSRRALSDRPLTREQIASLFEAARWAPSGSNLQPWLFIYASEPEDLQRVRSLLKENNQHWANRAPLLIFAFARKHHPETGAPLRTAAFDTGAAWQSLALQANKLGLSTRAMGAIYHERTYEELGAPEADYVSLAAIAVGHPDEAHLLPEDLQAREQPTPRKPTREFVFKGRYTP